jgi:Reverse transcriptase (RNA-dependent DNA polymerase)
VYDQEVIHHIDVTGAFLYGDLKETLYMSLPQGFETGDNQVCLLKMSLYGLKQAPRVWHQHLNAYLSQLKFKAVPHSECVFERVSNGNRIRLLVYVDDCLLISKSLTSIHAVKSELQRKFQITDLGPAKHFLGVEINSLPHGLFLHQRAYIKDVLALYLTRANRVLDNRIEQFDKHHQGQEQEKCVAQLQILRRLDKSS